MITLAGPLSLDLLKATSFANVAVLESVGIVEIELFNYNNEALDRAQFEDQNEAVDFALSLGLPDEAINYSFPDAELVDSFN